MALAALPVGDDDENNRRCRFCGRRFVSRRGSGRRGRKAVRFLRCVRTQLAMRQPGQQGALSDGSLGANWRHGIFIATDTRHREYQAHGNRYLGRSRLLVPHPTVYQHVPRYRIVS